MSYLLFFVQTSASPGLGLTSLNSNAVSGGESYDQLIQQYQQQQKQSQFRLQQMSTVKQSFREQSMKSIQGSKIAADHDHQFDLLGLLNIIGTNDLGLASISLGIDLLTLGLNLNSSEDLHKTFGSPWSDEPSKGDPEFRVPQCYYAKQPPLLHVSHCKSCTNSFPFSFLFFSIINVFVFGWQLGYLSKFTDDTLFFIFYR